MVAQTCVAHVCADELYTNANVHISLALLGARSNELLAAVSRRGLEAVGKRILRLCCSLRNFSLSGVGVAVVVTDRDVVRLRHTVHHAGVSLRVVATLEELSRQVADAGRTGAATAARCGRGGPRAGGARDRKGLIASPRACVRACVEGGAETTWENTGIGARGFAIVGDARPAMAAWSLVWTPRASARCAGNSPALLLLRSSAPVARSAPPHSTHAAPP